jgi:2-amino-4-hydroxy-6-hydroxymethyldihydropteridine diphosphokinase
VTLACIGLGSNVDPEASLRRGVTLLREGHRLVAVSAVYLSEAEGMPGPPFLNAAATVETPLDALAFREALKEIEAACGRPRDHDRWAPRTLDADLLLFGDAVLDDPRVPDPEILTAPWVLVPLADAAPAVVHPTEGVPVRDLLAARPAFRRKVTPGDVHLV